MAFISGSKNSSIFKQHYKKILNLINNSEWEDFYLHSTVLLEYCGMLSKNYNALNETKYALELLKQSEKIRKKLLGANYTAYFANNFINR